MRRRRDLLLNPFIQSALVFTPFGMAILAWPGSAWGLAWWSVALVSLIVPAAAVFRTGWFRNIFLGNMAVLLCWGATFLLAWWAAPDRSPQGFFLPPALFYAYMAALSGVARCIVVLVRNLNKTRRRTRPHR